MNAITEIELALAVNERNLRALIEPDGPVQAHFDEYQATTIRCVVNGLLNLSHQVREMAGRLDASKERPHSG